MNKAQAVNEVAVEVGNEVATNFSLKQEEPVSSPAGKPESTKKTVEPQAAVSYFKLFWSVAHPSVFRADLWEPCCWQWLLGVDSAIVACKQCHVRHEAPSLRCCWPQVAWLGEHPADDDCSGPS